MEKCGWVMLWLELVFNPRKQQLAVNWLRMKLGPMTAMFTIVYYKKTFVRRRCVKPPFVPRTAFVGRLLPSLGAFTISRLLATTLLLYFTRFLKLVPYLIYSANVGKLHQHRSSLTWRVKYSLNVCHVNSNGHVYLLANGSDTIKPIYDAWGATTLCSFGLKPCYLRKKENNSWTHTPFKCFDMGVKGKMVWRLGYGSVNMISTAKTARERENPRRIRIGGGKKRVGWPEARICSTLSKLIFRGFFLFWLVFLSSSSLRLDCWGVTIRHYAGINWSNTLHFHHPQVLMNNSSGWRAAGNTTNKHGELTMFVLSRICLATIKMSFCLFRHP